MLLKISECKLDAEDWRLKKKTACGREKEVWWNRRSERCCHQRMQIVNCKKPWIWRRTDAGSKESAGYGYQRLQKDDTRRRRKVWQTKHAVNNSFKEHLWSLTISNIDFVTLQCNMAYDSLCLLYVLLERKLLHALFSTFLKWSQLTFVTVRIWEHHIEQN